MTDFIENTCDKCRDFKDRVNKQTDWYQQRFNALRKWVNDEVRPLSDIVAKRYFAICANGSPSPHESADWSNTMHSFKIKLEIAEGIIEKLRLENNNLKTGINELNKIANDRSIDRQELDKVVNKINEFKSAITSVTEDNERGIPI